MRKAPVSGAFLMLFQIPSSWRFFAANSSSVMTPVSSSDLYCLSSSTAFGAPPVYAGLRHVAGTQWGNKKYMNMKHLEAALDDASIAG